MEKTIYLAAGCFWGAQKFLKLIRGVTNTVTGFANGNTDNPTYKEVYTDTTGYAEAVKVDYNPQILSLRRLLELYYVAIDPLSLNKQGEDEGTRYRTGIYYTDADDKKVAEEVSAKIAENLGCNLAVEILPLKNFYSADEYHQDYLDKNPNGYCHLNPEIFRLAKEGNIE